MNFINHFSGCQLCTQQNKEGDYAECEAEFVKSFEFADAAFSKALKRAPPRNITLDMQLAATPYCQVCWGADTSCWQAGVAGPLLWTPWKQCAECARHVFGHMPCLHVTGVQGTSAAHGPLQTPMQGTHTPCAAPQQQVLQAGAPPGVLCNRDACAWRRAASTVWRTQHGVLHHEYERNHSLIPGC